MHVLYVILLFSPLLRAKVCKIPNNFTLGRGEVVIGIHSGHDDKARSQMKSWVHLARMYNISVVYFGPGEDQTTPFHKYGLGRCPSSMTKCHSLEATQNMLKIYQIAHRKYPRCKLFIKMDDDTSVNVPGLIRVIREWLPHYEKKYMIGACEDSHKWSLTNREASSHNPYRVYCGGGPGFIITRPLLEEFACCALQKCRKHQTAPDDVFLSNCAKTLGAKGIHNLGFYPDTAFKQKPWVTQHHIDPPTMLELFDLHGKECLQK